MPELKQCFVIAPIGDDDSDIRERSDEILDVVIIPAATACDYAVERVDKISRSGVITHQIIERLVNSDLVIADLTGPNANVFYELAVRHVSRKPFIQLIEKGEVIPFDVRQNRTVYIDRATLRGGLDAKDEIVRQIRSLEQNPDDGDNPIAVSLDLMLFRKSDKPVEKAVADLTEGFLATRDELQKLAQTVSDPSKLLPPHYVQLILQDNKEIQRFLNPQLLMQLMSCLESIGDWPDNEPLDPGLKEFARLTCESLRHIYVRLVHTTPWVRQWMPPSKRPEGGRDEPAPT